MTRKKNAERNPVVLASDDYNALIGLVQKLPESNNDMTLSAELKRAVVVEKNALPPNTVRINSNVTILNLENQKIYEFKIVMPDVADINNNKVSILTPMGTALIGFRKGEEVEWQLPAGLKRFRILDVR